MMDVNNVFVAYCSHFVRDDDLTYAYAYAYSLSGHDRKKGLL